MYNNRSAVCGQRTNVSGKCIGHKVSDSTFLVIIKQFNAIKQYTANMTEMHRIAERRPSVEDSMTGEI